MNRCKLEDFADCYVDGSDKEISRAFQERLFSLGAKWLDFNDQTVRFDSEMTHICFDGSRISWNSMEYAIDNYNNEIEMEDLKPKPTKFAKVEESIFDLKGEFDRGELFTKKAWGEYVLIKEDTHLASLYEMQSHENSKIGIYRQVEIDWRDELDSYLDSISSLDSNFDEKVTLEFSKSKFSYNMSDSEFVAVCHLVASLTDKPE